MNELKRGIAISLLFHVILFITMGVISYIFATRTPPMRLDLSFAYNFKPLGNSLNKKEKEVYKRETEKKKIASKTSSVGKKENTEKKKRYGATDGAEGVDEFYIQENYRNIMGRIGNSILYPPIARQNGWEGKVIITFCVDMDGNIIDAVIKQSSGYPILDMSAIKTINSLTGIPKPRMITRVTVPIAYRLN